MSEGKRTRLLRRRNALWTERSSWDTHLRDIAVYQFPEASRFIVTDTNKGYKKNTTVYDNTAVFARRTFSAGMMSGMTSPARPWFRMGLSDKDLMEFGSAKEWLHNATQVTETIFHSGNTYLALQRCYDELGAFGTWADFVRDDFENVIHHYPLTVGEYALGVNDKGFVDTLYRDVNMTVGQMVQMFGYKNCSQAVRNLYDRNMYDSWVRVHHCVEPRRERDASKRDNKNMEFASYYFEPASDLGADQMLAESGYKRFPALCPRSSVTGNDVYGRSPGMDCLGDVKQLQLMQLRKAQAIDYMVNPPLQVPTQYKDQASKRLPGGVMFVDATAPGGGVRSAYEVNINLQHMVMDIEDTRRRINQAYYADLFLMLQNDERSGTTAREIVERHEEKMLVLGPVLERLQTELLKPLIDITFDRMMETGILPPPPKELHGQEIEIEFISALAQAQRAVAAAGVDRLLGTIGQAVNIWPEMRHKINPMQVVDDYADMYGVNPKIIVPDDVAQQAVAAEQQAQQAAAAAAAAPGMAKAASDVAGIDTTNARDVLNMFSGYNSPSAAEV